MTAALSRNACGPASNSCTLEARKRLRQPLQATQHVAAVVVEFRSVRPQCERPVETCECFGSALQTPQRYAAAGVGLDVIRLEGERRLIACQCFLMTAERRQCDTETEMGCSRAAVLGNRSADQLYRAGMPARLACDDTAA
jgi:hypothetical protein